MGFYIETPEPLNKARQLFDLHNAKIAILSEDFDFSGKNVLICVIENGPFDAAAIITDKEEMIYFLSDYREKTWLTLERETVIQLCPKVGKYLK